MLDCKFMLDNDPLMFVLADVGCDEETELRFLLEALESAYKSSKNLRPEEERDFEEAIEDCKKRIFEKEMARLTKQ
jgi:hypothetical protein